jgi:hypothetical protein
MDDFIFQTEPLEYQNTRQSTKITLLQNEVAQLQDHIKDLENMLQINRGALKISLMPHLQNNHVESKVKPQNNDTTSPTTENSTRENGKNVSLHTEQLYEDNTKLFNQICRLTKERNLAQSKALISEQICEEAQRHESEAVKEMEDKINELRKLLQDKEFTIQELEKVKPITEQEGIIIKYKEIPNPVEQTTKLQQELDSLNAMISKVTKEINKIQTEKQEMQGINFNLANEISKLRATFSSPLNVPTKANMKLNQESDLNNSCIGFMNMPTESDDSEIPDPMPNKVNLHIKDFSSGNKLSLTVPKLDLTKAKKIQEINAKKSTQQAQPTAGVSSVDAKALEKIKQLEMEQETQKKLLSREMVNNKKISDDLIYAIEQNKHSVISNESLIKSNKRYEEKWQKIFYTLEFYKEFYHKYIDLITNKNQNNKAGAMPFSKRLEKLEKLREKFNIDITETNPDQLIKGLKKIDEENGKLVNISILEADDADDGGVLSAKGPGSSANQPYQLSREQSKIYLLNLAKDLYVNTNINKSNITKTLLKNLERGTANQIKSLTKLKRSMSNPLDYTQFKKKWIYEQPGSKSPNLARIKKIKYQPDEEQYNNKQTDDLGYMEEEKYMNHQFRTEAEDKGESAGLQKAQISPILNYQKGRMASKKVDEELSFSVDPEDFQKNKMMNDVSFISNHGELF